MNETTLTITGGAYLMPAMEIQQAAYRYNLLVGFVKQIMKPTIHYGIIPGTEKPTLLKPGAEMLTTFFGLTPRFITVKEVEDWTGTQNGGEPFFYYRFTCQLWRGDIMIAEADGSCNSHEGRYRWRWVGEDDLPPGTDKATLKKRGGAVSEFDFAVDKSETGGRYGKPAAYWQQFKDAIAKGAARKITKTTKNGKAMDAWEIDTTIYRVPNDDIASQANTVLKIAQKRAYIAAVLIGVNASEFFTQDLEDLDIIDAPHYSGEPPASGPAWTEVTVGASEDPKQEPPQPDPPKPPTNGKCPVCKVTGDAHAPWCQEQDGKRIDTRPAGNGRGTRAKEQAPGKDAVPERDAGATPPATPTEPLQFLGSVNEATGHHYTNLHHLANALGRKSWPGPDEPDIWQALYLQAVEHAKSKAKTETDPLPPAGADGCSVGAVAVEHARTRGASTGDPDLDTLFPMDAS